jgi:hypothetical protein
MSWARWQRDADAQEAMVALKTRFSTKTVHFFEQLLQVSKPAGAASAHQDVRTCVKCN